MPVLFWVTADLDTVMRRDVKGLYKLARENKLNNLIGFSPSNIYEPPDSPDLTIDSRIETIEQSTAALYGFVNEKWQEFSS